MVFSSMNWLLHLKTLQHNVPKVVSYTIRSMAALHMVTENYIHLSETSGESMLPSIGFSDDWAIIDRRYKYGRNLEMGDIIVARKPTEPDHWVTKRITGMPGDIILIDPSKNTLSGFRYDESSGNEIKEVNSKSISSNFDSYVIVPEGHCWVTGDNLSGSLDSRTYSVMPMGLISAKLIYAWYMPPSNSRLIPTLLNFHNQYFRALENNFVEEEGSL